MNKSKFYGCFGILAIAGTMFTACSSSNDDNNDGKSQTTTAVWTTDGGLQACDHILFTESDAVSSKAVNDNGTQIGNGDQGFVFTGKQTLKKGTYILKGWVYLANGAELTIEPGTVIKGDKATKAAIIAERGGKLIAQGSETAPIVFTSAQAAGSRRPGDWGGIILCGKARTNATEQQIEGGPRTKHGGNDDADNSGVLSYVRIEFAGNPFQTDQEINGLTLGSVGSGTKIDHVQVSYSNDDSFEWFGGTVNCKYLIAYKGWDDDFDTDNGFSGHVQYCLAIRDPKIADKSMSNGFESDNNAKGTTADPHTSAVFSNVTFVGPKAGASDFVNTSDYINGGDMFPNNGSGLGRFQSAMQIRRDSHLSCFNSVVVGWPVGLILDNALGDSQGAATNGLLKLQNLYFVNVDAIGTDENKVLTDDTQSSFSTKFFLAQPGNVYAKSASGMFDSTGYIPSATSALLNAASFSDALLSTGFDKVSYVGAFGAGSNWTANWTCFDPQNQKY